MPPGFAIIGKLGMSRPDDVSTELHRGGTFPSTHWSLVLVAAQGESRDADQALASLCQAYWHPLYAFARKRGSTPQEAEDLTQEFFLRLVRKDLLHGLTRDGGKFRSFLLTALKRFLVNEWQHNRAQKRGGGKPVVSIDESAELRVRDLLVDHHTPETVFEHQWALTVLERALDQLRDEYTRAGKSEVFARLQHCLPGAQERIAYAEVGAALHLNEAAARMAAHRLRRRYGELLRAEIAATVSSPEEVDEEIRHMIEVTGQG